GSNWIPNCDFLVSKSGVRVLVELAGIRSADLEIVWETDCIRINGIRPRPPAEHPDEKVIGEINFGPFQVLLRFPPGYDLAQSTANYCNGYLRIDVPAAPAAEPRNRIISQS